VAAVLYERDELAAALEHATEGVAGCRQIPRVWSVTTNRSLAEVLVILAWIQWALGDHAAASAAVVEAERAEPGSDVIGLFNPASAERMRLLLAHGQLAQVAEWAAARRLDSGDQPSYPREGEYLVLARLMIAQGEPERALPLLARLHAAAAAQQRTGSLIEIGAVTARALAACGRETSAMAALAGTLTVAWPEGYVRVFADEGALLAAVLDRLITGSRGGLSSAPDVPPAYLRRLQTAFGPRDARSLPPAPIPAAEVAAPGRDLLPRKR
jgi:LuxR family transcriptional regulator, maltose regulon positive regulatory protein